MNTEGPDELEDDEDDDDDFLEDEEDGEKEDDDEDDGEEEDEEDGEEPETWQVVDFPAANCLDWRDFPAQLGWASFSRSRVATALLPRRRP
jgi:hypothetical protein